METLEPILPNHVRIYACGLTPYDLAHVGHARANITFDILVRLLRSQGMQVTFVRNVTDIDDKILCRSKELGESPIAFAARMADLNLKELQILGCLPPAHEPRVSEHIQDILHLIERLLAKGAAYCAATSVGHDVYFSVRSFSDYGKLSHQKIEDLLVGARVEKGEAKRDPLDFALWKGCVESEWGWPSPWGYGRPGWHIECSAMSCHYLGEHFDIHCGGMDLIFPHHENEIAQSESVWGPPFARYWIHNGFVTVDGEKMSKSLGNFISIADVLAWNDPEALRYFMLGTHYRSPLAFNVMPREKGGGVSFPGVDAAERRVEYLYATRQALAEIAAGVEPDPTASSSVQGSIHQMTDYVFAALRRDLNTPAALASLSELATLANEIAVEANAKRSSRKIADRQVAAALLASFDQCCAVLGLMGSPYEEFEKRVCSRRLRIKQMDEQQIHALIEERNQARAARHFERADELRRQLMEQGVAVFDTPHGTRWKVSL
ncbi:cysteine--tRNA ligase [Pajaroellobacter abortibovis]|uniref:Cysteine--tRNA ligase n=2 Tax=Pajaroellobacter abortibovis TaxID=1882918 RepID=A0A1L6MZN2_9BACT|nr:cysteine--tRNA ligase [Pajaroellobacter abortibovis]